MRLPWKRLRRVGLLLAAGFLATLGAGCPHNETTLDDRTLENRPPVETERPVDRKDPFRP